MGAGDSTAYQRICGTYAGTYACECAVAYAETYDGEYAVVHAEVYAAVCGSVCGRRSAWTLLLHEKKRKCMRPAFAAAHAAAATYATHTLPPITQQLPHTLRMLPQLPHPLRIRSLLHAAATTHISMLKYKKNLPWLAQVHALWLHELINYYQLLNQYINFSCNTFLD